MGTIQFKQLTFNYPDQATPLFKDVTLQFDASWRLGLIGRNGRGKTTLLKLLQRQLEFDGQLKTDLDFHYFPQTVADPSQLARDVLMTLGQLDDSTFWQIERELNLLKVDLDCLWQPFNTLSPGEQTKALLALLFIDEHHFQLIDEPTNHLDQDGRDTVAHYLQQKTGFIVISHDRHFLNQVIDHVLSINRADITVQQGDYQTWQTTQEQQTQSEQHQNSLLKSEIKRLNQTAQQKSQWSQQAERGKNAGSVKNESANLDKGFIGHRAAKVMKRATTVTARSEQAATEKQGLLKNVEITAPLTINNQSLKPQQIVLTATDLVLEQDGRALNQPLSFELKAGQQVALTGANGTGKSTFIKALLALPEMQHQVSGQLTIASRIKVSYLPQDFAQLSGSLADFAAAKQVSLEQLLSTLRKLGFEREQFNHRLETMSMGQKRKAALARSLCEEAQFYVWDEPLNYLDVITREQLQTLIVQTCPTLLFIEHDRDFIDGVASQRYQLIPR